MTATSSFPGGYRGMASASLKGRIPPPVVGYLN
jgi:hypothetical protein